MQKMTEPDITTAFNTQVKKEEAICITAVVVLMGKRNTGTRNCIDGILFEYNNIPISNLRSTPSPIDITDIYVMSSIMNHTFKPDTPVESPRANLRNIYLKSKSYHPQTFYLSIYGSEKITKVVLWTRG